MILPFGDTVSVWLAGWLAGWFFDIQENQIMSTTVLGRFVIATAYFKNDSLKLIFFNKTSQTLSFCSNHMGHLDIFVFSGPYSLLENLKSLSLFKSFLDDISLEKALNPNLPKSLRAFSSQYWLEFSLFNFRKHSYRVVTIQGEGY